MRANQSFQRGVGDLYHTPALRGNTQRGSEKLQPQGCPGMDSVYMSLSITFLVSVTGQPKWMHLRLGVDQIRKPIFCPIMGRPFMVKTRASVGAEVGCKGKEGTSTPSKERQRHKVWRLPPQWEGEWEAPVCLYFP